MLTFISSNRSPCEFQSDYQKFYLTKSALLKVVNNVRSSNYINKIALIVQVWEFLKFHFFHLHEKKDLMKQNEISKNFVSALFFEGFRKTWK